MSSIKRYRIIEANKGILNITSNNLYQVNNNLSRYGVTNTSELLNDGPDGINPYITKLDLYSGNTVIAANYYHISDYNYSVQASEWVINKVFYNTIITNVITLENSDGLDRIDVIVITSYGTFEVVKGTPSLTPQKPNIDRNTQVELTFIYVKANTTAPEGVVNTLVYEEGDQLVGGEWDTFVSNNTINPTSSEQADIGLNSIKFFNANAGDYINFIAGEFYEGSKLSNILFRVRLESVGNHELELLVINTQDQNGTPLIIADGDYGFDTSLTEIWQTIVVPRTVLGIDGKLYDSIQLKNNLQGATLFADNILAQTGTAPVTTTPSVEKTSELINDGSDGVNPFLTQLNVNDYIDKNFKGIASFSESTEEFLPFYTNDFTGGLGDFTFVGSPWSIDTTQGSFGVSAQSGGAGNNIESRMYYTFDSIYDGVLASIDIKQWEVEYCCDYLQIYVDGARVFDGRNQIIENYTNYTFFILGKGSHTVEFYYKSDGSTVGTLNKVNIDNFTLSETNTVATNIPLVINGPLGFPYGVDIANANFTTDITVNGIVLGPKGLQSSLFIGGNPPNVALTTIETTAIGTQTLTNLTTGIENVALGNRAGKQNTSGRANTYIGTKSGLNTTDPFTGSFNVFVGFSSGQYALSQTYTTAVGMQSGRGYTTSAVGDGQNSFFGANSGKGVNTAVGNSSAFGYNAKVTKSNQVVLGNSNVTEVRLGNGDIIYPLAAPTLQQVLTAGNYADVSQFGIKYGAGYSGQFNVTDENFTTYAYMGSNATVDSAVVGTNFRDCIFSFGSDHLKFYKAPGRSTTINFEALLSVGAVNGAYEQLVQAKSGIIALTPDTTLSAPTSSTDSGVKGEVRIVGGFRYDCIDVDTWVRSAVDVVF